MLRVMLVVIACVLLFEGSVARSQVAPISSSARLTGVPPVNPPVSSPGYGRAKVDLNRTTHKLQVVVQFQALASKPTSVRLHCCVAPDGFYTWATRSMGSPVFTPTGTLDGYIDMTLATDNSASWSSEFLGAGTPADAERKFADALARGEVYVVLYTLQNPERDGVMGGELRAFFPP